MAKDVVDLIIADHREVERLFEVLKNDPSQRPLVLPQLTALLVAHSRAEEAEVYPAARHEAGETDEVAHSQEEHVQAEGVLAKLAAMDPTDQSYASTSRKRSPVSCRRFVHISMAVGWQNSRMPSREAVPSTSAIVLARRPTTSCTSKPPTPRSKAGRR